MIKRQYRIKKATDFTKTYKFGKSYNQQDFYIKSLKSNFPVSRFAVVIPKKVTKSAVKRNTARRRVYEIIRVNITKIQPGYTIIITLKSDLKDLSPTQLKTNIIKALQTLKIYI